VLLVSIQKNLTLNHPILIRQQRYIITLRDWDSSDSMIDRRQSAIDRRFDGDWIGLAVKLKDRRGTLGQKFP
jgi:hypothetical protein